MREIDEQAMKLARALGVLYKDTYIHSMITYTDDVKTIIKVILSIERANGTAIE